MRLNSAEVVRFVLSPSTRVSSSSSSGERERFAEQASIIFDDYHVRNRRIRMSGITRREEKNYQMGRRRKILS